MMDGKYWISAEGKLGTIKVWTLNGSLIQQFAPSEAQTMLLDLSNCVAGMYMVSSDMHTSTMKIVK